MAPAPCISNFLHVETIRSTNVIKRMRPLLNCKKKLGKEERGGEGQEIRFDVNPNSCKNK